jgi:hypothetical protein
LASTSFAFMLCDVPAPAWYTSTTNWSRSLPARISSAACSIAAAIEGSRRPADAFARAHACFTSTVAVTRGAGAVSPLMGKFSTARWVCTP